MAINITSIKTACMNIQSIANDGYQDVIDLLNDAKAEGKLDTIQLDGATMATPFDNLIELIKQVKDATIGLANSAYQEAYEIYRNQIIAEQAQESTQKSQNV